MRTLFTGFVFSLGALFAVFLSVFGLLFGLAWLTFYL